MLRKALAAFFVLAFFTVILYSITFVSASSSEVWVQMYGGNDWFSGESFVQASDGGFLIAGYTDSGALLLKTDSNGNMEWNQTYGDIGRPKSLVEASDGGYVLVSGAQLVKFDVYGNIAWNRTLLAGNTARSLIQTSDGGYAIAGTSGGVVYDKELYFWLVKTDELGYNMWNKTYETLVQGGAASLIQTLDGGYALLGTKAQGLDFMLVKTDSSGELEWNKIYEKRDKDAGRSIVQNSDGGYTLAGRLWNRSMTGNGGLIKTDSNGNMLWMKNYPSNWQFLMAATSEGGYVLCSNLTLIKTDSEGNTLWTKGLDPPPEFYYAYETSVIQTHDGGYAILGEGSVPRTDDPSTGVTKVWIIKTDQEGIIPEFPSWIILPLFLAATLTVIIFRKKLHRTKTQQSY